MGWCEVIHEIAKNYRVTQENVSSMTNQREKCEGMNTFF